MKLCLPLIVRSLTLVAAIAGCSQQPQNAAFRNTALSRTDLAGVWKVTPQSLSIIDRFSTTVSTNISFDLQLDGRVLATNFPLNLGTFDPVLSLETGKGSWEIDQRYATFDVQISLQGHSQPLDVREFKGKLLLTFTLGDPDSGETIVFRR